MRRTFFSSLFFSPRLYIFLFLCLSGQPIDILAQPLSVRPQGFDISDEVQSRIDFWKLVFTKYGKDHLVFHHREHPRIIYSVLDMSEFNTRFYGRELARVTNKVTETEEQRIQGFLNRFAGGARPSNPEETRLYQLFSLLEGNTQRNFRAAAETGQIRSQQGIRELFAEGLKRSGRYLPTMEREFKAMGLPVELTRLPLVESSFNYSAYSSVGAAGIWQFMRATGKRYMRIDSILDERKDPIISTRAAARYLEDSYRKTSSWPLAITSYNHGLTGILRAANAVGSRDLGTIIKRYDGSTSFGFASKNFYAEFMAALEVEQHSERYFPGLQRERALDFVEVQLSKSISFRNLQDLSGADAEELENLNRSFLSPILNGRSLIPAGSIVKLPSGSAKRFANAFGAFRAQPTTLSASQAVKTKDRKKAKGKQQSEESTGKTLSNKYQVRKGDTLAGISKRFGLSIAQLKKLNPGIKSKIKPGQFLITGN